MSRISSPSRSSPSSRSDTPNSGLSTFAPDLTIDTDFIRFDHPLGWMVATRFFQLNMYRHWDPYAGYQQKPPLLSGVVNGAPDSEELRDHNLQRVCDDAIKQVRHLWTISFQTYSEYIHLTTWPSLISPVFFQLIMAKTPRVCRPYSPIIFYSLNKFLFRLW
ncbi:hypothetical protein DL96DRAFT_482384 [Flagelloscypha sp. PMI_526]|nr:hypothetical protein DL96DRAFT_482384 [Flagelloscypha sp. PMI_526]